MEIKRLPEQDIVEYTFGIQQHKSREEYVHQWERYLHKASYRVWQRLPNQIKMWMDAEDLYQEAYAEALACYDRWDPTIAGYSTYMCRGVQLRLSRIAAYWQQKKRFPNQEVEVAVLEYEGYNQPHGLTDAVVGWLALEAEFA